MRRRRTAEADDLDRFVLAQDGIYPRALAELRAARKTSHWMWFVFPQLRGLGSSAMAWRYGVASAAEAEAYLAHAVLGPRLLECSRVIAEIVGKTALEVLGSPDDVKLRSCMTLFAAVPNAPAVFHTVLERYFGGESDPRTLALLSRSWRSTPNESGGSDFAAPAGRGRLMEPE